MDKGKTTKRTPEAIRMYNDIREDFHVIDVIANKLSLLREISTTYGKDTTLKEAIEKLEDRHFEFVADLRGLLRCFCNHE